MDYIVTTLVKEKNLKVSYVGRIGFLGTQKSISDRWNVQFPDGIELRNVSNDTLAFLAETA